MKQFQQKQSPWVWKDTYIFVDNCRDMKVAAHPLRPEQVTQGMNFMDIKDTKGNTLFPKDWCEQANKPSGTWVEYWWPKPGQTEGSRKLVYALAAKGTPYVVAAGVYDDNTTLVDVSKLTSSK